MNEGERICEQYHTDRCKTLATNDLFRAYQHENTAMRVELRIVAGELRRRKLTCNVNPQLRPTPQMVREALFSILGHAIPNRLFIDLFAGTGINGLEAVSRGASMVQFVERDFRLCQEIENHLKEFKVSDKGQVIRTDAYRWAGMWRGSKEPVNVFISPPFADLQKREDEFLGLVENLRSKLAPGSTLVIQSERQQLVDSLPDVEQWDIRTYGRNMLLIWEEAVASSNDEDALK